MTPCRFPPPRRPRSRREFVAQRAGYPSPHASAPARRNRRPRSRRHRRNRRPARVGRGAAIGGAWREVDLDRGGQDRLRDRAGAEEQRLVHAAGRADQRGVLPRPVDAERAQPRAGRHRRATFTDRASTDMRPPVSPPDARSLRFTAGRHRDTDGKYRLDQARRHRPAPRRARRPGAAASRWTAGATGSTPLRPGARQRRRWTTAGARPGDAGGHRRRRRHGARRPPGLRADVERLLGATTAGPT